MLVGEKIRQLRKKRKLSLEELARRTRVSKSYLWQMEKGKSRRPSAEILYKIATALGTTIADLLGLEIRFTTEGIEDLPPGLKELAQERDDICPEDIRMLANIHYRGRQPKTKQDWNFIYEAIVKSVGREEG